MRGKSLCHRILQCATVRRTANEECRDVTGVTLYGRGLTKGNGSDLTSKVGKSLLYGCRVQPAQSRTECSGQTCPNHFIRQLNGAQARLC